MWVTILPFFLVANITVDDAQQNYQRTKWATFGPEYTYDVLVNMSLANIVQENDNFCAMLATDLKCRPKGPEGDDSLRCHFQNSRIKRPDPKDNRCSNAKDFVPSSRYKFVNDEPFEIRFNSKGIENLVVHRSIPRWRLDMIKTIVSQLNVGFEMPEHRDKFTIMENSTMGHCEVDVKIIRNGPDSEKNGNDSIEESENFKIEFVGSNVELAFLPMERLQVEKIRQPKRCPRRMIYFFGDHEDYSHSDRELHMDMTTSNSHITISKDKFISYTISEGVMKTANKSRSMRPYQKISLKLKRIDLAETSYESIPEIKNPASTSLFAFSNLQTIPEDE
ncbi:PREDICTED: vitellogenin-like [Wasmannia auropunctata]|uniref:vitellogenin-like n=1 Tax=Wasmannia auropunctata TaxID=64793 RepID=UPI0005EE0425|nr:PREDICTED: vitellogenin-like [Wasmannia auropunctata]